ncbi:hypothetical protein IFM89_002269, partial [Coptis chinensis]
INLAQCDGSKEEILVQSQRYEVQGYDSDINLWFSNATSRPCYLLRCFASQLFCSVNKNGSVGMCRDVKSQLNFVNEAQFLLISEESISDLNTRLISIFWWMQQMPIINLDHLNGQVKKSKEPLATLASFRQVKSGVFLRRTFQFTNHQPRLLNEGASRSLERQETRGPEIAFLRSRFQAQRAMHIVKSI